MNSMTVRRVTEQTEMVKNEVASPTTILKGWVLELDGDCMYECLYGVFLFSQAIPLAGVGGTTPFFFHEHGGYGPQQAASGMAFYGDE